MMLNRVCCGNKKKHLTTKKNTKYITTMDTIEEHNRNTKYILEF